MPFQEAACQEAGEEKWKAAGTVPIPVRGGLAWGRRRGRSAFWRRAPASSGAVGGGPPAAARARGQRLADRGGEDEKGEALPGAVFSAVLGFGKETMTVVPAASDVAMPILAPWVSAMRRAP